MEQVNDQQSQETEDNDRETIIRLIENEKKKMREEFDSQRAKLKELFLQKEDELQRKNNENSQLTKEIHRLNNDLDEFKSQLCVANLQLESRCEVQKRKAEEEIATLQQLVHETVEESSSSRSIYDSEVKNLHALIGFLKKENYELKNELQHSPHHSVQEQSSLAPSVISTVTKKLVKKLGADAFTSQDNADDSTKAQEDVELLRSLITPLEEEIRALKDKLRATDEQLQKCRQCGHLLEQEAQLTKGLGDLSPNQQNDKLHSISTNTSFEFQKQNDVQSSCDMCSNYEAQLVKEQQRGADLQAKVIASEKAAEKHREDLLKEIGFRKDMEEKWHEKKEEHKQQVMELTKRIQCAEQNLKELEEIFRHTCEEAEQRLNNLQEERVRVHCELEKLQKENDCLVGKFSEHSQQLQNEVINLPDTVEELHELLLKSYEDLIIAKVGQEAADEKVNSLKSEMMLLKTQIINDQQIRELRENNLESEINSLKQEKDQLEKEADVYMEKIETLNETIRKGEENLSAIDSRYKDLSITKKQLEGQVSELKMRVTSLQQELDNSEAVQKDFVRLSQSLQVQLEKIRDSDTEVRWQHDEDVEECPTCRLGFTVTKYKQHCRHCGQIFCISCLPHTVFSGPHRRPSKVCDVCHTLLVKSSAPYFSTEAPHSPD